MRSSPGMSFQKLKSFRLFIGAFFNGAAEREMQSSSTSEMHWPMREGGEVGRRSGGRPTEAGVSFPSVLDRDLATRGVGGPGVPATDVGAVENWGAKSDSYEVV